MKIVDLRHLLICGTCSWLLWAAPSQARFLQVDPVGYKDQTNLYAYVGNNPVNGSDPTGEFTVVYHGPEAGRLRAVVEQAAGSDPELSRRYQVLQQSTNVHDVYAVQPIFPNPQSLPMGENANENAQNGIGTGSRAVISLEPVALAGQGIGGVDITASPGAQAAHEVLSHSYDTDQGTNDPGIGLFGDESKAIAVENTYRRANGEEQRVRHFPEEPW